MTTTSLTPRFTRQSARRPALGHGTIAIAMAAYTESGLAIPAPIASAGQEKPIATRIDALPLPNDPPLLG